MKTSTPDQVEIRIPRRAEFVRVARMAACALASQLDFTYDLIKDVELAVGEACANAVEHVCDEESNEIIVRFSIDPTQLQVEVLDRGQGFDPQGAAKVGSGSIDDWDDPGGLGLVVIREVMDELTVECDPTSGTCVRMVKHRSR
ncbi:MAG TPA: ATP-binding protein [Armatimonadota bacterium]|nr:ATP-binding protein [Armatimonadota bacterium]